MTPRTALITTMLLAGVVLASPTWAAEKLILGYSMAKTGPFVSLANSNEVAADIAVEEINAAGGVNGREIELVKFDTAGNPKQAAVAVRKFAKDVKALAVIGPFSSSECKVAFPAGERLGIAQMSMASSAPNLAKPYKFAFRNTTDEFTVISLVLKTIKDKGLPASSAAIAYATDDTVSKIIGTKVLPKILKTAGYAPKQVVTFKYAAFDLSPQVSRLAQTPVDLIGLGAPPEAAIKLAKEMKRQGLKGRIFGGTTVADVELPKRMDGAGEGMTIGRTFYRNVSDRTRAFAKKFAARARAAGLKRTEANQFDAATYDIVYLYAAAMKAAGATGDPTKIAEERAAIASALNRLKNFPALEGPISFGANGDALKPLYVLEIKSGAWSLLGTQAR
ncbi:MAG: amino acid ABC transporter substrate-binding protein [Alphaproteobacteria bacterium]|nr:MAG: amino acid ABC transporter substrate-binding protein [Alphaproteobacteria bacterium]